MHQAHRGRRASVNCSPARPPVRARPAPARRTALARYSSYTLPVSAGTFPAIPYKCGICVAALLPPSVRYRDCFGIRTLCFLEQTIATRNPAARFPPVSVDGLGAPCASRVIRSYLPAPESAYSANSRVVWAVWHRGFPYSPPARMGELWFICVI